MCDCGSKVFFDELGYPWPLHDCEISWTRRLKRTKEETGQITVELSPGISVIRTVSDTFGIDENLVAKVRARFQKQTIDPIAAIEAINRNPIIITGILRDLAQIANPIKNYQLNDTAMSRAMLGPISAQPIGKITVHVPTTSGGQLNSYTVWVPTLLLNDSRLVRGITVSLTINGVPLPGRGYAWFCNRFEMVR